MLFPFTFKFGVPDIINPFAHVSNVSEPTPPLPHKITAYTPPPSFSRKRGWDPAFAEPSMSAITPATSTGYLQLDTPTASRSDDFDEVSAEELPPPTKRRRGLAGSLVSTALSAALIGTAVGLTVYRLWRDRGKDSLSPSLSPSKQSPSTNRTSHDQLPPPPPYSPNAPTTPKSASRKYQHRSGAGISKRSHRYPQSQRSVRTRVHVTAAQSLGPEALFPPAQPEFNVETAPHPVESPCSNGVDDQMDWIGDKLTTLIAEGKRALGREIVVMSDSKEDEVDDGSGAWEDSSASEPESLFKRRTPPRRGSIRRGRREPTSNEPSSSHPVRHTFSASTSALTPSTPPMTPRRTQSQQRHTYGRSLDSTPGRNDVSVTSLWMSGGVETESSSQFESPELRESMERARQKVLSMRGLASKTVGVGSPTP
ncbi:hypothetical protein AMATHDRAFT_1316 [Amanita thiersii Skay4041]|uniref:Uncharacterized protein n=1 Tax=Amanita thiersii Skay4041 TaxID=703135 RepID=A0A2A9NXQ7_9AGAR|nr:hypothetical protein AMATHDRAFT_1316 [Amanita thiersii Skay4041]